MSQPEPEATPAQQEAVRRLLAEARHGEPLPDDVASRLDDVLAQLAGEGARGVDAPEPAESSGAVVVDLAARRRRRVTGLLGAAAAVVVLGVGVGQLADLGGSADQDDSTTFSDSRVGAASAEDADGGAKSGGESSSEGTGAGAAPEGDPAPSAPQPPRTGGAALPDEVTRIGSADFQETVLRLRNSAVVVTSDQTAYAAEDLTREPMFVCPPTVLGAGRALAVSFDGSPAVLAYREPTGDTQTVELLQCGTGEVQRSVVIPAP